MASEISRVNGVETAEVQQTPPSPVKQISAVITHPTKHAESTPVQNGTPDNATTDLTAANAEAAPASKIEPKAVVVDPAKVEPVAPPAATIEPVETNQLSTPPEKVPEKPTTSVENLTDSSKKPVEQVDEKTPVEELEKSDDKETTDVVAPEEPPGETPQSTTKKPGRKPAGRPKKTVTEKATEAGEPVEKPEGLPETHADIAEATTAAVKKTPRKKRESATSDAHGDKTPLLETSLVVEGKRSRQKTDRLDSTVLSAGKRDRDVNIAAGTGMKLGEIPFIDSMISKTSPGDLRVLHRIIFGKVGVANEVKKHIRQFNGFDFSADSIEYEKKHKFIENLVVFDLKHVCDILGLDKSGKKDELAEAIMKFCVCPSDTGKAPSAKSTPSPNKTVGDKRKSGAGRKRKMPAAESGVEDDEVAAESEGKAEPAQPTPKRGRPSKASTTPAAGAKATPAKRAAAPTTSSMRSAKKPAFPTDADLKSTIKELLKGVNLELVTMKEMTAKVYEKYPGADLTSKKDFIKDTVKSLLSSSD